MECQIFVQVYFVWCGNVYKHCACKCCEDTVSAFSQIATVCMYIIILYFHSTTQQMPMKYLGRSLFIWISELQYPV